MVDVFRGFEGGGGDLIWVPVRYTAWSAARVKVGVDRQPADERLRTRSPYLRAFVSAARAWTIWKNTSVEMSVDGDNHHYRISGRVCRGSTPGCDARLAKEVFDDVNDNDIPFTFDDETTGPRNLLLVFPIRHDVSENELKTINKTLPGHPLHPKGGDSATVTHQVDFETGDLRYHVTGKGDGPFPFLNNALGVPLFLPGVYQALWKAQSRMARRTRAGGAGQ